MRYGVISDVHANLAALEAVLAALDRAGVDRVLCAGDLVGYGPQPRECLARLAEAGVRCVAGNHDLLVLGDLPLERTGGLVRETLEYARRELGEEARGVLAGLPASLDDGPVTVAHGSLDDPETYVTSRAAAATQLERLAARRPAAAVLILGHTHAPRAFSAARGELRHRRGRPVALEAGDRLLLNPGSVGQARERRPLARYLVLDADRGEARLRSLAYDHDATRRALADRGLPPGAHHRPPSRRARAAHVKAAVLGRLRPAAGP